MSDSPDSIRTSTAMPAFLKPFPYDQVGLAVFLVGWAVAGITSIVNRALGDAPTLFERNGWAVALWLGLPLFVLGLLGRHFSWQVALRDVKIKWLSQVNAAPFLGRRRARGLRRALGHARAMCGGGRRRCRAPMQVVKCRDATMDRLRTIANASLVDCLAAPTTQNYGTTDRDTESSVDPSI